MSPVAPSTFDTSLSVDVTATFTVTTAGPHSVCVEATDVTPTPGAQACIDFTGARTIPMWWSPPTRYCSNGQATVAVTVAWPFQQYRVGGDHHIGSDRAHGEVDTGPCARRWGHIRCFYTNAMWSGGSYCESSRNIHAQAGIKSRRGYRAHRQKSPAIQAVLSGMNIRCRVSNRGSDSFRDVHRHTGLGVTTTLEVVGPVAARAIPAGRNENAIATIRITEKVLASFFILLAPYQCSICREFGLFIMGPFAVSVAVTVVAIVAIVAVVAVVAVVIIFWRFLLRRRYRCCCGAAIRHS